MPAGPEEIARLVIRLQGDTAALRKDLESARGQIKGFASAAKQLLAGFGIALGLNEALSTLKEIVSVAHEHNAEIERTRVSLAAIVGATSELEDATGRRLEGEEKMRAAFELSGELMERLETYAAMLGTSTAELAEGFSAMVGPGRAAGMTLQQILDISVRIAQAMKAMNLPMVQLRVEAGALLRGEENIRADIMRNLGIRAEEIKLAQEQGRQYEYLMEKLRAFGDAAKLNLETWTGIRAVLGTILVKLAAAAEMPLFEAAKSAAQELTGALMEAREGTLELTDGAKQAAREIGASLETIVLHFRAFRTEYGLLLDLIVGGLRTLNISLASFLTGLTTLLYGVHSIGTAILVILNKITLGAIPPLNAATRAAVEENKRLLSVLQEQAAAAAKAWPSPISELMGAEEASDELKILVSDHEKLRRAEEAAAARRGGGVRVAEAQRGPSAEELKQAKDAVEKITDKVRQLRSEQEALVNPLEGSRLALEAWIQQTTRGAAETPELKQAIEELRGQFESLQQAKSAKARLELVDKEALAQSKAELETAQAEIQDAYDRGAISLDEYYRRRRDIIERAAESELAVLRAKQARAASEEERGEVGLQILEVEADRRKQVADLIQEQAKAAQELARAIREGASAEETAKLALELERVEGDYRQGMITIQEYYAAKRAAAQQSAQAEIGALEERLAAGVDERTQVELRAQVRVKTIELERELLELSQQETEALKQQAYEALSVASAIAAAQARAGAGEGVVGELRAQYALRLAQMDEQQARELDMVRAMHEEKIQIQGEWLTKAEALDRLRDAHQRERLAALADYERQVLEARLSMAQQVFGSMASAFDQLYTETGKKHKALFYAAKAAALAEAIVNTALAVTKAWAQGGPIAGPILASIAASAGAVQIGIILGQTIAGPGAKEGGLIEAGGRWDKDDVPVRLSRREFVLPRRAVEYYGVQVLEAMRRRMVPREIISRFQASPVARPFGGYQTGGEVLYGDRLQQVQGASTMVVNLHNEGTPQRVTRTETRYEQGQQMFDLWLDNVTRDYKKRAQVRDLLR